MAANDVIYLRVRTLLSTNALDALTHASKHRRNDKPETICLKPIKVGITINNVTRFVFHEALVSVGVSVSCFHVYL